MNADSEPRRGDISVLECLRQGHGIEFKSIFMSLSFTKEIPQIKMVGFCDRTGFPNPPASTPAPLICVGHRARGGPEFGRDVLGRKITSKLKITVFPSPA